MTEDVTDVDGSNEYNYHPIDTVSESGLSPIIIAVSLVVGILILIILAVLLIKVKRDKDRKRVAKVQRSANHLAGVNAGGSGGPGGGTNALLSVHRGPNGTIRRNPPPNGNTNTLLKHSKSNGFAYDPDR